MVLMNAFGVLLPQRAGQAMICLQLPVMDL